MPNAERRLNNRNGGVTEIRNKMVTGDGWWRSSFKGELGMQARQ